MAAEPPRGREIVVAISVDDPALADRIEEGLGRVPGLRLLRIEPEADPDADVLIVDGPTRTSALPVIMVADRTDALELLRAGYRAVLPTNAAQPNLWAIVAAVAQGYTLLTEDARDEVLEEPRGLPFRMDTEPRADDVPVLTPREAEVLRQLAEGASNKMIARRLAISPSTAKFHVGAVLAKLGARSRADAVAQAARLGLLVL